MISEQDQIFKALADTTRRQLLDRLYAEPGQSLNDLCSGIDMRRQSVTKHLRLLEGAGLVVTDWQGREKRHYLNPVPIQEISRRWIDKFSGQRAEAILNLKAALEQNSKDENK